jgi:AcrR family transcriptional regulator
MNGTGSSTGDLAPPRRSRANTRTRLVEAAAEVFAAKPFGKVTVDDLVGAAGFTRGAFYSNFSSIEELFFEVYADLAERMLAAVDAAIADVPPEEFSLESFGVVFDALHPFGRTWFLIHQELVLQAVRDPLARERLARHAEELQGPMEQTIGQVLDLLGREPVVTLSDLTGVMLALYLHGLGNEQLGAGSLDAERLVSEVLPQLVLGLSRPRP